MSGFALAALHRAARKGDLAAVKELVGNKKVPVDSPDSVVDAAPHCDPSPPPQGMPPRRRAVGGPRRGRVAPPPCSLPLSPRRMDTPRSTVPHTTAIMLSRCICLGATQTSTARKRCAPPPQPRAQSAWAYADCRRSPPRRDWGGAVWVDAAHVCRVLWSPHGGHRTGGARGRPHPQEHGEHRPRRGARGEVDHVTRDSAAPTRPLTAPPPTRSPALPQSPRPQHGSTAGDYAKQFGREAAFDKAVAEGEKRRAEKECL